jgi:hypothetical protein
LGGAGRSLAKTLRCREEGEQTADNRRRMPGNPTADGLYVSHFPVWPLAFVGDPDARRPV